MRTAVLKEPGRLEIEERPRPDPAPDEVLVAVGEGVADLGAVDDAFRRAMDDQTVKGMVTFEQ
jgi:NADPH:quinone reductase-like Zn-dependent oxidoreductase